MFVSADYFFRIYLVPTMIFNLNKYYLPKMISFYIDTYCGF